MYQYTLQTNDTAALYESAPKLEQALHSVPGLVDVSSDLQLANPQVNVSLDRDRIAALGLTVDQVESAMANAYSTIQVSTIYAPTNEYQVLMRVAPQYQDRPDALSLLYIRSARGALVPLSAVASFKPGVGPQLGQPHRTDAVGDALVQPRAGHVARRRHDARAKTSRPRCCRRRSSAASRAPRRRFRTR